MNVKKKIKVPSEAVYVASCVLLALAVAMLTAADFGVSMIVAPAYILHLKLGFLTFGQAEYVIQALFFVFVFHLPFLRSSPRPVAVDTVFQHFRNAARKHTHRCPNRTFRGRVGADVLFGRACFQNISLPAGIRLFRKKRQFEIRNKTFKIQDLFRPLDAACGDGDDAFVLRRISRNMVRNTRDSARQRNDNRRVLQNV